MSFKLASLALIQEDKTFAALAEKYQPKEGLNYLGFTFHGSAPLINMKAMAITPATMAKSLQSANDQMVDFEHRAEDIPIPREDDDFGTEIVGYIKEVVMGDIPSFDDADAWAFEHHIPAEPILTMGVMVMFTRVAKVRHIAQQVAGGAPWYFSLEIGDGVDEPAIWLQGNDEQGHEIIPWSEAPEDLRTIASQPQMMEYNGRNVAYLMGGADGFVPFIGGAITRNPAGFEQRQPGKSLQFFASAGGSIQGVEESLWKSDEWKQSVKDSLKTGKEDADNQSDDSGIVPIVIGTIDDLKEVVEVFEEIKTSSDEDNENEPGGDNMPEVEMSQVDFDKAITDAKTAGLTEGKVAGITEGAVGVLEKAVEDGTHIPAEDVDGIVTKRAMSAGRTAAIGALECDEQTQGLLLPMASNVELYPLDEEGETKFAEALKHLASSFKPAESDKDKDADKDKDKDKEKDKKNASDKTGGGEQFDMGTGGGGGEEDDDAAPTMMKQI